MISNAQEANLFNHNLARSVRAFLRTGGGSFAGATRNATASDGATGVVLDTVAMRNQAQTHQIEIEGNTSMTFALGFETGLTLSYDSDGDGLPDWWETEHGSNPNDATGNNGAGADLDGDGWDSLSEFIAGTDPAVADSTTRGLTIIRSSPTTVTLQFPTALDRVYRIYYRNSLQSGSWTQAGPDIIGNGAQANYVDDGAGTGSAPTNSQPRFYKLEIRLLNP